jgi:hypothetical protein
MSIDELKAARLREKASKYGRPEQYIGVKAFMDHFFAEVGKLHHLWYHDEHWMQAFADVSNLHDIILARLKEREA